jgi:hypothetical protein
MTAFIFLFTAVLAALILYTGPAIDSFPFIAALLTMSFIKNGE